MPRITRIAISFFAVSTAYWLYALIAVPLIEPTTSRRADADGMTGRAHAGGAIDQRIAALAELFPADSWVLKNPKILESDQFQLLMRDYRNRGDGRLELRPCAIIVTPEGPAETEQQRWQRAIVLEAPEGALLEFDRPLDLRRGDIGQIVGGQLQGRVTIRSQGESDGPEDDLLIVTRDIEMTRTNVFTPHAVDFRFGPHYGRGQELHIKLAEGKSEKNTPTPDVAGIELFELRKVERLHLQMGKVAADQAKPAKAAAGPFDGEEDIPVEITCEGPFRFDIPGKVASFNEKVCVLRINRKGRNDQLTCEKLAIHFVDRAAGQEKTSMLRDGKLLIPTAKRAKKASLDLAPQRLEATGKPVIMSAPDHGVEARGELLRYDLETGQILLKDEREAFLRQEKNEIHGQSLLYLPDKTGRLARMTAQGPGWLRGHAPDRPDDPLEVSWKKEARVYPEEQQQVVKIEGSAWLRFRGVGQLEADTVYFRLDELPPEKGKEQRNLRPRRMDAEQNVRIRSPQLDGAVETLTVVFKELPPGMQRNPTPAPQVSQPHRRIRSDDGRQVELTSAALRQAAAAPQSAAAPTATIALGAEPEPAPQTSPEAGSEPDPAARLAVEAEASGPAQRFEVTGKTLRADILLGEREAQVSEVNIEGDARFAETKTARPDERPVLVRGDRIRVTDAETPHTAVTVLGEPAQFEGRGMAIESRNIHLNRGTNRLLIDGAGAMTLPLDRDFNGQPLATAARMVVHWRSRMEFDGRTARFEEAVVARTPEQALKTEILEVQFREPIRLGETDRGAPSQQVEQILCRGGTLLESRTVENLQMTAHERIAAGDLTVNLISGDLTARGQGWLMSVRHASDRGQLGGPAGSFMASPAATEESESPLRQLYVRFQGGITGNVHRRELNFHDDVHTVYTPVDCWEPPLPSDDPHALGPRGIVMNCDRLSLRQTLRPNGAERAAEFEAAGNTIVESAAYTARAIRMTYSEAKDLLVLEGDGRSDAQLFRQQQIGGPMARAAAQRILFWPGTNRLKVDGARALELSQFQ